MDDSKHSANLRSATMALIAAGLGVVGFMTTSAIFLGSPFIPTDTSVYFKVAQNILYNGCVSLSAPESGQCTPHWGGNQLPGYPAFLAMVWWLSGSPAGPAAFHAAGLGQALLYGLAIARLVVAVAPICRTSAALALIGCLAVVSPFALGWWRSPMTEPVVIAIAMFLFAECITISVRRKVAVVRIGVLLASAVFVRFDGLFLAVLFAVTVLTCLPPRKAIKSGLLVMVVMALPLSAWTARSLAAGLPLNPLERDPSAEGASYPSGAFSWYGTWGLWLPDLSGFMWPILGRSYATITVPQRAYHSEAERNEVEALLARIRAADGRKPLPADIDTAFARLAEERRAASPVRHGVVVPALRAGMLWLSPANALNWQPATSAGLSAILREERQHAANLGEAIWRTAQREPWGLIRRGVPPVFGYALLSLTLITLVRVARKQSHPPLRPVLWSVFAYGAALTVFHAYWGGTEARYLSAPWALLYLGVLLCLMLDRRHSRATSRGIP